MRQFDCNPYGAQDEKEERDREEAASQDAVEEQQENEALRLYNGLPEGTQAIFSPQINTLFGELFDTGSDADELVNDLLYKLSKLEIKRREAA
ncbi:hypothetical protein ID856_18240 [Xenorhabdus sp. 18]|uniref:hypothetical protein n=1 Tax=Xenorhabdus doucetiae TaxID=351671 RepID=UPI0019BED802|nr:hypothetical protein [Xenorhabdus sp. 18]MBD2798417.1 hypothetical protein [Xenorhabdus sp. 18]